MIVLVGLLLSFACFLLAYEVLRRSSRTWRLLNQFPGDYPLPFIGNALQVGIDSDEVTPRLKKIWKRLGMTNYRISLGNQNWIILCEPDDVGVLLSHTSELSKPVERNAALMPFFGNSLSSSEGEKWVLTRKLMTPNFHFKTLEKRVTIVNDYSDELVNILSRFEGKEPVNVNCYLRPFMFDILCKSLMGIDMEFLKTPEHSYIKESGKLISIATENYFSYWRNINFIFKLTSMHQEMMTVIDTMRNLSNSILEDRKAKLKKITDEIRENNKDIEMNLENLLKEKLGDNACLLDQLILSKLPNGEPMPDHDIIEEITLLCFTGHYTTTMTMAHTLYCLAKHPEIQKKVIEEQKLVLDNDLMKKPTHQDLNDMKYLEAVIKETMRIIPTVPKIGRELKKDLQLKDGRIIPSGTTVIVSYDSIFYNPKVYPEPEKYQPERFFENLPPYSFVPFSAGPRNCIGFRYAWIAMKATISNIVRTFEVIDGGVENEPQFAYRIITESKNGVKLRLKKRKSARKKQF